MARLNFRFIVLGGQPDLLPKSVITLTLRGTAGARRRTILERDSPKILHSGSGASPR
jgi:hypothetical protein